MKLRYMIEYALRDRIREPRYEPIGVWVQGPGPGLDLVIEFLPGNADAEEDAQWVVNRLVEQGVRSLPDDFLAYHQGTLSQYRGMRGPVIESEEFVSAQACAPIILGLIGQKIGSHKEE
ncbi:conserved hypothetical protein [uncultured Desulfatiglans sp.]|uniref:Uncharacterized protein n=1 Tax=Uncultured Desulfatiglans sp. TaxID=1748965 RepID=A0A653A0X5_UNCDX|nr:conserved hypothetical protein [uncultured Desulfatiglans sp.]